MSREAELIDEARRLFREALGTEREDAAYAYLSATVAEVKRRDPPTDARRAR